MRPSITWLLPDSHFNHENMVILCNRPPDFKKKIIDNLIKYCMPQDLFIHLGDLIFNNPQELESILSNIRCQNKILVRGNHDRETNSWYRNRGFSFVCDSFVNDNILFSHKPQEDISKVDFNIHGHWHNTVVMEYPPIKSTLEDLLDKNYIPSWYNFDKHILLKLEHTYAPFNLQSVIDTKKKELEIKQKAIRDS